MNRHGIKTTKKEIFFMSFKGNAERSSLNQVTLPPHMGMTGMVYRFGEWLKREGNDWESASEEQLCRWATDFWNRWLEHDELPRRFDRMATTKDLDAEGVPKEARWNK